MELDLTYPGIACYSVALPLNPKIKSEVGPLLPDRLKTSHPIRVEEYLGGRYCAIKAAEINGFQLENIESGESREPLWPSMLVGSISHSKSLAISCVADSAKYSSVGIDTETLIDLNTLTSIKPVIALPDEIHHLDNLLNDVDHSLKYTLLFSIKESFYKAIYPLHREFIDFKDVFLKHISFAHNDFEVVFRNKVYPGKFFLADDSVITVTPII